VAEVRDWLNGLKSRGMQPGLARCEAVLSALDLTLPPAIHVAGSNGKGTTCAILAETLRLDGLRVGLFTSPHLVHIEERVRIDGEPLHESAFDAAATRVMEAEAELGIELTFFEATFLLAMCAFEGARVDTIVLETGLGGRLDATRCAAAELTILTSITREHADILGDTLAEIAAEKAAIARPGKPMVALCHPDPLVESAVEQACQSTDSPLTWVVPLPGAYAREAAQLAEAALAQIRPEAVGHVEAALSNLHWPGRMDSRADLLLEAAHNPSGMERACAEIEAVNASGDARIGAILFGCTPQSDMDAFIAPLARLREALGRPAVVLTVPRGGRHPGVGTPALMAAVSPMPVHTMHPDPVRGLELARRAARGQTVLVIGSLYLVGNILADLDA